MATAAKKRVKEVYETGMVAHIWAQQSQDHARNSARNFFFDDDTIFSYGNHFAIARFVRKDLVFFTTRGYSNTTAGHISCTRGALADTVQVIHLNNVRATSPEEHADNLEKMVESVTRMAEEGKRSRYYKGSGGGRGLAFVEEIRLYCRHTKQKFPKLRTIIKTFRTLQLTGDIPQSQRAAAQPANQLTSLENWKKGKRRTLRDYPVVHLRKVGGVVETSKGARVSLTDAKQLFEAIQAVREKGADLKCDIHVGEFNVQWISRVGDVIAGCHHVKWPQIEEFAKSQGWLE